MTRAPESRRAALYLRVSSVELPHGAGDAQLAACAHHQELALRQLVEERGWQVQEVYCDRTASPKDGRPALKRLLADARRRAFDVVVTAGLDRFARSLRELILALDELRRLGVDFVSLRDGIDSSTPEGRIMVALTGKLAALDSALASERTRLALECARRQGTRTGRPIGRPRRIFDCVRALELREQGLSYRQISVKLGIPLATLHTKLKQYRSELAKATFWNAAAEPADENLVLRRLEQAECSSEALARSPEGASQPPDCGATRRKAWRHAALLENASRLP